VNEPRIIVFQVGGLFLFTEKLEIPPYTSVLGQTAPADSSGVTIALDAGNADHVLRVNSHSLLRFVRIRRRWDETSLNTETETDRCCGNGMRIPLQSHIALDHLSMSWGGRALLGVYNTHDLLLSNSILTASFYNISHSPHMYGYGAQVSTSSSNITFTRNIFYSGAAQWPGMLVSSGGEIVNNLVYGADNNMEIGAEQSGGDPSTQASFNLVGNRVYHFNDRNGILLKSMTMDNRVLRMYVNDNVGGKRTSSAQPESAIVGNSTNSRDSSPEEFVMAPFDFGLGTLDAVLPSGDLLATLSLSAGARRPAQDSVDATVIAALATGEDQGRANGPDDSGGYATPAAGTPWVDEDGNGIPDEVEQSMFGRHVDSAALTPAGYSFVETWANSQQVLADAYVPYDAMLTTTTAATTTTGGPSSSGMSNGSTTVGSTTGTVGPAGATSTDPPATPGSSLDATFFVAVGSAVGLLLLSWIAFAIILKRRRKGREGGKGGGGSAAGGGVIKTGQPAPTAYAPMPTMTGSEYTSLTTMMDQTTPSPAAAGASPDDYMAIEVPVSPRSGRARRSSQSRAGGRTGDYRSMPADAPNSSDYGTMPALSPDYLAMPLGRKGGEQDMELSEYATGDPA
jgi:hypothetical protein